MADETRVQGALKVVEVPRDEKMQTFYSNQSRMAMSQYDLAIEFGEGFFC